MVDWEQMTGSNANPTFSGPTAGQSTVSVDQTATKLQRKSRIRDRLASAAGHIGNAADEARQRNDGRLTDPNSHLGQSLDKFWYGAVGQAGNQIAYSAAGHAPNYGMYAGPKFGPRDFDIPMVDTPKGQPGSSTEGGQQVHVSPPPHSTSAQRRSRAGQQDSGLNGGRALLSPGVHAPVLTPGAGPRPQIAFATPIGALPSGGPTPMGGPRPMGPAQPTGPIPMGPASSPGGRDPHVSGRLPGTPLLPSALAGPQAIPLPNATPGATYQNPFPQAQSIAVPQPLPQVQPGRRGLTPSQRANPGKQAVGRALHGVPKMR